MDDAERLTRMGLKLTPALLQDLRQSREAGMEPSWSRVWRDGQDVTDRPELWPWPWNRSKRPGER